MRSFLAAFVWVTAYLTACAALAQAPADASASVRTDTPSGFPVPRFVSLKHDKTYCRTGPSFEHPIAFTYIRAGLPVQIVAETMDHWRRIRDFEGTMCWVHQTKLRAADHAIITRIADVLARPRAVAPARVRVGRGVIVQIGRREGKWRQVRVGQVRGWIQSDALWGAPR